MAYPSREIPRSVPMLHEGDASLVDPGPAIEARGTLAERDEAATLPHPALGSLQAFEERLRRLEDAVAAMQEVRPAEPPRAEVLPAAEPVHASAADGTRALTDPGLRLLPLALDLLRPAENVAVPVASPVAAPQTWLVVETYHDLRCIFHMFTDRRYRVRWSAMLIPVGLLFVMLLSWLVLSNIILVGPLLDKLLDLVLAFFAYKVLVREAQHYRQVVARMPGG